MDLWGGAAYYVLAALAVKRAHHYNGPGSNPARVDGVLLVAGRLPGEVSRRRGAGGVCSRGSENLAAHGDNWCNKDY